MSLFSPLTVDCVAGAKVPEPVVAGVVKVSVWPVAVAVAFALSATVVPLTLTTVAPVGMSLLPDTT